MSWPKFTLFLVLGLYFGWLTWTAIEFAQELQFRVHWDESKNLDEPL